MNEFEYGERVLVSDNEDSWEEGYFITELNKPEVSYLVARTGFDTTSYLLHGIKFERFTYIKKWGEKFEINITKNGEPYEGTISEETARNLGIIE